MSSNRPNFVNFFLFFLVIVILIGLQTTFWFQMFGNLPAPMLWLNIVLYFILYRRPVEGIISIYALGLFLNPFTAMPLGIIWTMSLIMFAGMLAIKKRIFWPGSRYFFVASAGMTLAYHICYLIVSRFLEPVPAPLHFFHRLSEIVFTPLTAIPIYTLLTMIDKWTNKETLPESGSLEA